MTCELCYWNSFNVFVQSMRMFVVVVVILLFLLCRAVYRVLLIAFCTIFIQLIILIYDSEHVA